MTNERAKWRNDLRNNISEFCKIATENDYSISKLQKVRLTPNARKIDGPLKHKFDHEILKIVSEIYEKNLQETPMTF